MFNATNLRLFVLAVAVFMLCLTLLSALADQNNDPDFEIKCLDHAGIYIVYTSDGPISTLMTPELFELECR